MAKIDPDKDGKYNLGDSEDTILEDIDSKKYDVYTEEEKLGQAQSDPKYPKYVWFVSFTITDKNGKAVDKLDKDYSIKLNELPSGSQLYYYVPGTPPQYGTAYPLQFDPSENKDSKKRIKAKLKDGDPPIGHYP